MDRRFSISMIPVGSSFDKLVVHEAGGHGFAAKLLDEYVYYETEIPAKTRSEIASFKTSDSISMRTSPDTSQTTWRDSPRGPDYPMVGTYLGAAPTVRDLASGREQLHERQCRLFHAPSRWAQIGVSGGSLASRIIRSTRFARRSRPAYPVGTLGNRFVASCRRGLRSSRSRRIVERRSSLFERRMSGKIVSLTSEITKNDRLLSVRSRRVIVDTACYHYLAGLAGPGAGFRVHARGGEATKGVSRMASLDIVLHAGDWMTASPGRKGTSRRGEECPLSGLCLGDDARGGASGRCRVPARRARSRRADRVGLRVEERRDDLDRCGLSPLFDAVVDGTGSRIPSPIPRFCQRSNT